MGKLNARGRKTKLLCLGKILAFFFAVSKKIRNFATTKEIEKNMEITVLNEAQLSILRLLGSLKTVEEADELRQVICDYYARRVDEEVDKL